MQTGSRRTALLSAVVLALGGVLRALATPNRARAATLKRAYRCPGPIEASVEGLPGTRRSAQVFTATTSGTLRQIRFQIAKFEGTSGDYVVQLVKVVGSPNGTPSNSPLDVLAAVTIRDATVPVSNATTLTATFAGTRLQRGQEYAAVLSRPGNSLHAVHLRQGGGDCAGQLFAADGSGTFDPVNDLDLIVTVLVA